MSNHQYVKFTMTSLKIKKRGTQSTSNSEEGKTQGNQKKIGTNQKLIEVELGECTYNLWDIAPRGALSICSCSGTGVRDFLLCIGALQPFLDPPRNFKFLVCAPGSEVRGIRCALAPRKESLGIRYVLVPRKESLGVSYALAPRKERWVLGYA